MTSLNRVTQSVNNSGDGAGTMNGDGLSWGARNVTCGVRGDLRRHARGVIGGVPAVALALPLSVAVRLEERPAIVYVV